MRNKLKIYIISAAFILFVSLIAFYQMNTRSGIPVSVQVVLDNKTETINLWEAEDGNLYAFLPSYAASAQISFRLNTNNNVYCDGKLIENGMLCDLSSEEEIHTLTYTEWGKERSKNVVFVTSANVPAMYIDTQSGSMEYIHQNKGNEETAVMRLYSSDGATEFSGELQSIKGRGNASWTWHDKKPYTIELTQEANLLGMGNANTWILLANAADYSNMRNKIVYDFAEQIDLLYSPGSEWVELYLNGEYTGLYLLSEKIEVHQERVNLLPNDSHLVSIELQSRLDRQNIPYVRTSMHTLRLHYPETMDSATLDVIENQWNRIENSLNSDDGVDPISGKHFREIVDIESWAKNYLIDEVFGNLDAFIASRYFYYDSNGQKVIAGPVWDYDKSLGNDVDKYWYIADPCVQIVNRYANKYEVQRYSSHYDRSRTWANELYEKPWFKQELVAEFERLLPEFEYVLNTKIDEYSDYIGVSAELDRKRWILSEEGTFEQEVSKVSDYLENHIEFLKDIWLNGTTYYQVSMLGADVDRFYSVSYGECLEELPIVEDNATKKFVGWYYSDTDEPFDINKPITEDTEIYAKWEAKSTSKIKQVVKLAPLGAIGLMGLALLVADIKKQRGSK